MRTREGRRREEAVREERDRRRGECAGGGAHACPTLSSRASSCRQPRCALGRANQKAHLRACGASSTRWEGMAVEKGVSGQHEQAWHAKREGSRPALRLRERALSLLLSRSCLARLFFSEILSTKNRFSQKKEQTRKNPSSFFQID